MAIERSNAPTQIALPPKQHSRECMALMMGLAEARGGSYSSEGYEIYTRALAKFDLRDVKTAVAEIAEEPRRLRKVGEAEWLDPAIPELGEVIARVRAAERRRTVVPIPHCGVCDDQRLVVKRRENGTFYAADCECLKAWRKRKLEAANPKTQPQHVRMNAAGQ